MELEILKQFRDVENPKLGMIGDVLISSLKKEQLIDECGKRGVDILDVCRLANIDPSQENLVKLFQHVMDLCVDTLNITNKKRKAGAADSDNGKKAKQVDELMKKVDMLERKLDEKSTDDSRSEYERASSEAKSEASKKEDNLRLKYWESAINLPFDPQSVKIREPRYVTYDGKLWRETGEHLSAEEAYQSAKNSLPSLSNLKFPEPAKFLSGQIHSNSHEWEILLESGDKSLYRDWIEKGININDYITHFKGSFWGKSYDTSFPPPRWFNNANKCKDYVAFINKTLLERLQNGSIECLGKIGTCSPPHIVAPLTVEPSKPRLCLNLMYLNNWIKDVPFTLDTLKDIPGLVKNKAFFTSVDDKSGFDNVKLHPESYKLVGFQWAGFYYCFRTLPFGFKLSSYIYHTLNLQVTSYIRRTFGLPIFLYIDDRLIEEVRGIDLTEKECALLAIYIVCEILIRLGYCINLDKSVFEPTQTPVFLGFIVDSVNSCFRITKKKKSKFIALREELLLKSMLSVLDLQKFAGRAISLMIAVPAARLYIREVNAAISWGIKKTSHVKMYKDLYDELCYWRFLDSWTGYLAWKSEKHLTIELFTDASKFKYGGVVRLPQGTQIISEYWLENERNLPIMVLEGFALLRVLQSIEREIRGKRVDAHVDNMVLINAWNNEGCKSQDMNMLLKDLFSITMKSDIFLALHYVKSKDNVADKPSRSLMKSDAMLTRESWLKIQSTYGGQSGHSFDLMALDSNCMKDKDGNLLKHYTPYQTPLSEGVNLFAQEIGSQENCYIFPPFCLVLPVIKYVMEEHLTCTLVVPLHEVTPIWLPTLTPIILDGFLLGYRGQRRVIRYPSKAGFLPDQRGLTVNLWAVRLVPRNHFHTTIRYGKLILTRNPSIGRACHFLCIGDSMIRFLAKQEGFNNPMIHVISVGGALISDMPFHLKVSLERYPPRVIFIHVGVNNLSKCYLYPNEYTQMSEACKEYDELEGLSKMQSSKHVQVILSSIVNTKDEFLNSRANIMNSYIEQCCKRNGWLYLNNDYLKHRDLRDTVHLNRSGEETFTFRLLNTLKDIII